MTAEDFYHIVAAVAGPIGAAWALIQWYLTVEQRKTDLRWKQAEAAWKLIDSVYEDLYVTTALRIIDGEVTSLDIPDAGKCSVDIDAVDKALDLQKLDYSEECRHIRHCFDCLLYAFERIEMAIASDYVRMQDIKSPTRYYSVKLYNLWPIIEPYGKATGYIGALHLIERFTVHDTASRSTRISRATAWALRYFVKS